MLEYVLLDLLALSRSLIPALICLIINLYPCSASECHVTNESTNLVLTAERRGENSSLKCDIRGKGTLQGYLKLERECSFRF